MTNASNIVVELPIDGISRIKLNEPSTYNALSSKMLESLINIFKEIEGDLNFKFENSNGDLSKWRGN